jgi:heterodisulfide reductase subunit B
VNLDSGNVEVLVNGYVEYEIPKADFPQFAFLAFKAAKKPTEMPRVRNAISYTIK